MKEEKARILVIDDDPVFQKYLQAFLPKYGYKLKSVYNGEEALNEVNVFLPDVILLDIVMPDGIDGHEVCKRLKRNEQIKNVPVILVSASAETVDKVKGFSLGAVDYIHKPFQPEEILARIGMHLKNSEPFKNKKTIKKVIEFSPEHYQAGMNILSYFQTVLRTKYPDDKVKVKIEQEGTKVTMSIESEDGTFLEKFNRTFEDYSLVMLGKMPPEEFTNDSHQILELKNERDLLEARLKMSQNFIEHQRDDIEEYKELLRLSIVSQKPTVIHANASSSSSPIIDIDSSPQINIIIKNELPQIQGALNELIEELPIGKQDELDRIQTVQDSLKKIENFENPDEVKKSASMSKLKRFVEDAQNPDSTLNKTLKAVTDGVSIVQNVAKGYNSIAEWCGLPIVPKLFLKGVLQKNPQK